jgi:hypothetical protein
MQRRVEALHVKLQRACLSVSKLAVTEHDLIAMWLVALVALLASAKLGLVLSQKERGLHLRVLTAELPGLGAAQMSAADMMGEPVLLR